MGRFASFGLAVPTARGGFFLLSRRNAMDLICNWLFDRAFPGGTSVIAWPGELEHLAVLLGITLLPRWWRRKQRLPAASAEACWQGPLPCPLPSGEEDSEGAASIRRSAAGVGGAEYDARYDLLRRIAQHAPQAGRSEREATRSDRAAVPELPNTATPRRDAAAALATISEHVLALFADPKAVQVALPALTLFSPACRPLLEATGRRAYLDPIRSLWNLLEGIDARQQVALMDRCLQTLATASPEEAQPTLGFLREVVAVTGQDHWQVRAWCALAEDAVAPPRLPKRSQAIRPTKLIGELIELLSVVALAAEDADSPSYRFHRGWRSLPLPEVSRLPAEVLAFSDLETALERLAATPADLRARVCDACTIALTVDGKVDTTQAALLRLIRQRLGHPPYPVLPGNLPTA